MADGVSADDCLWGLGEVSGGLVDWLLVYWLLVTCVLVIGDLFN